jgi:hypothetical protein
VSLTVDVSVIDSIISRAIDEAVEQIRKRRMEDLAKKGLNMLEDKEALRRWRLTKRNRVAFLEKYHVSEQFIENQISVYDVQLWRMISSFQAMSYDFIVKHSSKISFSDLRFNPFVDHEELEEKGVYVMAKLADLE